MRGLWESHPEKSREMVGEMVGWNTCALVNRILTQRFAFEGPQATLSVLFLGKCSQTESNCELLGGFKVMYLMFTPIFLDDRSYSSHIHL